MPNSALGKVFTVTALIVVLLLMQSLTIWHDAEHFFHEHDSQCERFETYSSNPALDIDNTVSNLFTASAASFIKLTRLSKLPNRSNSHYFIRAPPIITSLNYLFIV